MSYIRVLYLIVDARNASVMPLHRVTVLPSASFGLFALPLGFVLRGGEGNPIRSNTRAFLAIASQMLLDDVKCTATEVANFHKEIKKELLGTH